MPAQLEVAPHGNSRQQPCPECGHKGSVETYPHDRVPHTFCFACSRWTPLDQFHHDPDPATAADRAAAIEAEKLQQQREAAVLAQRLWSQATPAQANHPYLVSKQVVAGEIRQLHAQLVVPLFDLENHLWNLQTIDECGEKFFLKNSRKKGCFFVLGSWGSSILLFCEGWATGVSLHQATQHSVVVCFDAGNLLEVAQQISKRFPDSQLVICADNDHWDSAGNVRPPEKNVGVVKATRAAQAVNGVLVVPEFPPATHAHRPTDWNDLHTLISLAEVGRQIAAAMHPPESTAATLELNEFRGSDDANANLLLELHGTDLRFCSTWNKWLVWSGEFWKIDDELHVFQLAADVPKSLYQQAAACNDKKERWTFAKLAFVLESVSKRNAMLIAAKHRVAVHHNKLDTHAFLLNVANGELNLTTGKLQNHHRENLLTHFTDLAYDATATAPTWQQFLEDVFLCDDELIHFIQKAVGYSLTGDVREQCLFIAHGVGSNGKSVFLNILRKLLGTLALQSAPDLLMADKQRRHPTEQADLFGKRLVICTETEEGHRFKEVLVKQLTGGDSCRARRMHEDFWEFNPTWKIFIATNHKPEIRGTDHAIWRRIRLIPFNVKFHDPGEGVPVKNLAMEAELSAELPGILTWAVQGCLAWQQEGLQAPTAVKSATDNYKQDMDVLAAFFEECCVTQKHCQVRASDLYAAYTKWCEQSGEYAEKQRKFGMRLTERGFTRFPGAKGYSFWRGIGLKDKAD